MTNLMEVRSYGNIMQTNFLRNNNYIRTRKTEKRHTSTISLLVLHYSQKLNLANYFSNEIFHTISVYVEPPLNYFLLTLMMVIYLARIVNYNRKNNIKFGSSLVTSLRYITENALSWDQL